MGDLSDPISKNHGLAGGNLDATPHLLTALPRLFNDGQDPGPVRDQMAEMATAARTAQALDSELQNG